MTMESQNTVIKMLRFTVISANHNSPVNCSKFSRKLVNMSCNASVSPM